jgi:hypothetical protein
VIVADHGESYGRRDLNRRAGSGANFWEVASVPLIVKRPYQRQGHYSARHVRNIDVLPTIAHELGIRIPWRTEGRPIYSRRAEIPSRVEFYTRRGQRLALSLRRYRHRIAASIRRMVRLFGSDAASIYRFGPNRGLLQRPLAELHVRRSRTVRAKINLAGDLARVDLASGYLPTQITGRLSGARARPGLRVAVAVNGVIAATGRSFRLTGSRRVSFSVMVPEPALSNGPNRVEALVIIRGGPRPRLARLGATG